MQGARSVALAHHLSTSATLTHESRAMAVEQLAADRLGEHIGGVECCVNVLDMHFADGLQLAHLKIASIDVARLQTCCMTSAGPGRVKV